MLFTAINLGLALLLWVVGGLAGGLLRRYRRHGHRPGMWLAAAGFVLALLLAAVVALVADGAAAVVVVGVALVGWSATVALLAARYDAQDRRMNRMLEEDTLADVLLTTAETCESSGQLVDPLVLHEVGGRDG
jgi:hypothetical protein